VKKGNGKNEDRFDIIFSFAKRNLIEDRIRRNKKQNVMKKGCYIVVQMQLFYHSHIDRQTDINIKIVFFPFFSFFLCLCKLLETFFPFFSRIKISIFIMSRQKIFYSSLVLVNNVFFVYVPQEYHHNAFFIYIILQHNRQ